MRIPIFFHCFWDKEMGNGNSVSSVHFLFLRILIVLRTKFKPGNSQLKLLSSFWNSQWRNVRGSRDICPPSRVRLCPLALPPEEMAFPANFWILAPSGTLGITQPCEEKCIKLIEHKKWLKSHLYSCIVRFYPTWGDVDYIKGILQHPLTRSALNFQKFLILTWL